MIGGYTVFVPQEMELPPSSRDVGRGSDALVPDRLDGARAENNNRPAAFLPCRKPPNDAPGAAGGTGGQA